MQEGSKEWHQRDFAALPDVRNDALHRAPHHLQWTDRQFWICQPALLLHAEIWSAKRQAVSSQKKVVTWERSSLSFSYSGLPRSSPAAQHAQPCKPL